MTGLPFYLRADDAPGRRRLLGEALRLFAGRGLAATGIREIARAAGVTNPALYRHFDGKEALALELFVRCYRELDERLAAAVAGTRGFEAGLEAFLHAFLALYDEAPEAVVYVQDTLPHLWPQVPATLRQRTVITTARDLLHRRPPRETLAAGAAAELRVVALLGLLAQLARTLHQGALPGPAGRWLPEVRTLARRMLG